MRAQVTAVLALALAGCTKQCEPKRENAGALPHALKVVDMHMHISPSELDRTHEIMDEVGIAWGLNLSGMWPGGPLEQQLEAAKRSGRLLVACNLPWHAAHR